MMDLRSRVSSLLQGKTPDRLPWFADLAYWHFGQKAQGLLDERYRGYRGVEKG